MHAENFPAQLTMKIRSHTLAAVVQQELEKMILSGELAPDSHLSSQALADRLIVSRGPVREACHALAELGLVYLVPNRGMFVRRLVRADVLEVLDFHAGLSALACSLSSRTLDPVGLARLEALVDAMEGAAHSGDAAGFQALNLEFHQYIVHSTGNSRLIKLDLNLMREIHLLRMPDPAQRDFLLGSNAEHREILAALEARDMSKSHEASLRHTSAGKAWLLRELDGRLSA